MIQYIGILPSSSLVDVWQNHGTIWEIMYCLEGSGTFISNNKSIPFSQNDIIVNPPYSLHHFSETTICRDLFLMVDGPCPFKDLVVLKDTVDRDILSLIMPLYRIHVRLEPKRFTMTMLLLEVLIEYLDILNNNSQHTSIVEAMGNLIVNNIGDPEFRIADIYRQLYLNEDQARAEFRKAIGQTPQQYLTKLRIEQACWMLSNNKEYMNINEIARCVGILDPQYFSRIFKKYTGLSPRAWKNQTTKASQSK